MKKIFILAAFALSSLVHAQDVDRSSFDRFMHKSLGGGLHTISMASNGTPIAAERISNLTPGGGWVNAGQMSVATHPQGLEVRGRAQLPVGPNTKIPVNVSSLISGASVIASLQRCMGNFLCATAMTAGSAALGQWLNNNGISLNPSPTSSNNIVADLSNPELCFSSCYSYLSSTTNKYYPSVRSACLAGISISGDYLKSITQEFIGWRCQYNIRGSDVVLQGPARAPDKLVYGGFSQSYADRLAAQPIPNDVLIPLLQAQYKAGNESGYGAPAYSTGVQVTKTTLSSDPVVTPSNAQKTVTTEKIINADGTTSLKETTKQTSYQVNVNEDGSVKVKPITTTTLKIDGQEVPDLTKIEDGKTNDQQDIETCGLPNTPACKINEDGTPEAQQDTHKKDVDDALVDLKRLSVNPETFWPTFPQIRWDFALPTGCAAIAIPAFAPWLQEIDICQFQPIFHDIMSVVWVLGGLFGAISTFWRSTFSKAA